MDFRDHLPTSLPTMGLPTMSATATTILPHRAGRLELWRVQAGRTVVADLVDIEEADWLRAQLAEPWNQREVRAV